MRGNVLTDPKTSNQGLAQGSPLSPLLFNLYTASLHEHLQNEIKMLQYADDLVISKEGYNLEGLIYDLNQQLRIFETWHLNTPLIFP